MRPLHPPRTLALMERLSEVNMPDDFAVMGHTPEQWVADDQGGGQYVGAPVTTTYKCRLAPAGQGLTEQQVADREQVAGLMELTLPLESPQVLLSSVGTYTNARTGEQREYAVRGELPQTNPIHRRLLVAPSGSVGGR